MAHELSELLKQLCFDADAEQSGLASAYDYCSQLVSNFDEYSIFLRNEVSLCTSTERVMPTPVLGGTSAAHFPSWTACLSKLCVIAITESGVPAPSLWQNGLPEFEHSYTPTVSLQ